MRRTGESDGQKVDRRDAMNALVDLLSRVHPQTSREDFAVNAFHLHVRILSGAMPTRESERAFMGACGLTLRQDTPERSPPPLSDMEEDDLQTAIAMRSEALGSGVPMIYADAVALARLSRETLTQEELTEIAAHAYALASKNVRDGA